MEPFVVDYAMQRGHEMLITRDPPLTRTDMDEIDLHMLQAETIPRLLRVDWLEVDGCFQLRYSLTGKRMLSQKLIAQPPDMTDYYALLLGLIEALDECRHYLLRESCCLLDERYLFVGEQWSDVWIAYVPLREGCMKQTLNEALLSLAARWGARVREVEGSGLQAVLKLLENPGSTLSGIRSALLELLSDSQQGAGRLGERQGTEEQAGGRHASPKGAARRGIDAASSTNPLAPMTAIGSKAGDDSREEHSLSSRMQSVGAVQQGGGPARLHAEPTGFLEREWRTETGIRADASRSKWVSGALALLVCACCWRYVYMPSPGMETLLICAGLSLLLLWGVVTLWVKLGRKDEPLRRIPLDELDVDTDSALPWGRKSSMPSDAMREPDQVPERMGLQVSGADRGFDRVGGDETSFDPPSGGWEAELAAAAAADETALLSAAGASSPSAEGGWLMREHRGQSLRIALQAGISVIGRSADISHIVDVADGVSRTHLELEWDGQLLKVRDLASRNGSALNGTAMVPYKLYELQRTDWIQLAGADGPKYTLHLAD